MLVEEKIMGMMAAYDLTNSFRSAAALCGVDHHTVKRYVAARDAGLDPSRMVERARVSDPFCDKITEWNDKSQGRIRAEVVHRKLEAMGYRGSERATRRVVAALKTEWGREHRRGYKPRIRNPGCGCSGPTVTGLGWPVARRVCFVPGWRGHGSG